MAGGHVFAVIDLFVTDHRRRRWFNLLFPLCAGVTACPRSLDAALRSRAHRAEAAGESRRADERRRPADRAKRQRQSRRRVQVSGRSGRLAAAAC